SEEVEGPHHALLLLLNPEPSAGALDGWREHTHRGKNSGWKRERETEIVTRTEDKKIKDWSK
ncbi:hypothetical protein JOQ06_011090, partial [Pogonophryne albipinna]